MMVRTFAPADFLGRAGSWLEAHEVEHQLFFRIAGRVRDGGDTDRPAPFFATVESSDELVALAAMTPPYPLVISNASAEARHALMDHLDRAGIVPSGINGHADASGAFAREWIANHGGSMTIRMHLGVYEATAVTPAQRAGGFLRRMELGDMAFMPKWLKGFAADALGPDEQETDDQARNRAQRWLAGGGTFIWVDGDPRAMANSTGASPHGICINGVYTPPEFRRRGYALACVAALTQRLLDEGRRFVCLFTDLANPTSNSIYRKIGYRKVCEFADWKFNPPV